MKKFKKIKPTEINENAFKLIGSDWMLITAGKIDSFNTMTASWGGFGVLWNKNVCNIFVRPQRYTFEFLEKNDHFTLSFFSNKYKKALNICGSKSGRNIDKISEAGLNPVQTESGNVTFDEASIVVECKKIYYLDIDPKNFMDPKIDDHYPEQDYHRLYFGEILNVMKK